MIDPKEDGIKHINIYSKGRTPLGVLLSNFTEFTMFLPEGTFSSLEGYWYWLLTKDDRLMKLSGYGAKKLGQMLTKKKEWLQKPEDIVRFKKAMRVKAYHPGIEKLLKESKLPFKHYYVFQKRAAEPRVIEPKNGKWMLEEWELIRKELKCSNK